MRILTTLAFSLLLWISTASAQTKSEIRFEISPRTTAQSFSILMDSPNGMPLHGILVVKVHDIIGNLKVEKTYDLAHHSGMAMDIEDYKSGVYLVTLNLDGKVVRTAKIVRE